MCTVPRPNHQLHPHLNQIHSLPRPSQLPQILIVDLWFLMELTVLSLLFSTLFTTCHPELCRLAIALSLSVSRLPIVLSRLARSVSLSRSLSLSTCLPVYLWSINILYADMPQLKHQHTTTTTTTSTTSTSSPIFRDRSHDRMIDPTRDQIYLPSLIRRSWNVWASSTNAETVVASRATSVATASPTVPTVPTSTTAWSTTTIRTMVERALTWKKNDLISSQVLANPSSTSI